ncbi:RNA polymerase sigma factor, partial [Klebsiella pneumoniae]
DDRVIAEITIRQGLGKIDPAYREIIELVDIWGFQYADVSTVLDIPVGTVMSRLSRARLALLEIVAEDNLRPMRSLRSQQK